MILYVNGDSHSAAAECVNPHAWAKDDGNLYHLDKQPHPDNLQVSWGCQLAQLLNFEFVCQAQSGGSNDRILRTTRAWLEQHKDQAVFVVIQWSTWEREEWFYDGEYYQVNASGTDHIPTSLQEKYRQYVLGIDWNQKTDQAHDQIWEFHLELQALGIQHVFFNGNSDFSIINQEPGKYGHSFGPLHNWGCSYVGPYDTDKTYDSIIRSAGIPTVTPSSWHFGKDGHSFFARFMLQYITDNQIIQRLS